jgi:hypothetical protein
MADDNQGNVRFAPERVVALGAVAVAVVLLLWEVHIDLVLRNTTPIFGDLGAHLHEPHFVRHHLLSHGRLSGWSQDWFGGYPVNTFYFPLGSVLGAVLSFLLPYNVAFKLVTVAGVVALPVCAYAFGRLNQRGRLLSASLAVATLPFLLQGVTFTGGTLLSTVTGEFSFGLSLAVILLVLGLAGAGFRTGRYRAATAGLLAVAIVLHVIPALMAVVGMAVLMGLQPSWARLRWLAEVLAGAGALAAFWLIPFLLGGQYTTGPDYAKAEPVSKYLFLGPMGIVIVLAACGALVAGFRTSRRDTFPLFLVVMAVLSALAFSLTPTGRLWSGRFLPFWLLFVALLAGTVLYELAASIDRTRVESARGQGVQRPAMARMAMVSVFLLVAPVLWGSPAGRGLLMHKSIDVSQQTVRYLGGYERQPERREFQNIIDTMRAVGRDHGCGRAQWEWNTTEWVSDRWALMNLLPYWTDGCVQSTEGLYVQSAATSRYVHLANGRLASPPTEFLGLPKHTLDVATGVEQLRRLGVRYYIAASSAAQQQAAATAGLTQIASTVPSKGNRWQVYEISDVDVIEPLLYTPVVVPKANGGRSSWEGVATAWFDDLDSQEVVVSADGPDSWPRRSELRAAASVREAADPAEVSRVRVTHERVSFHVDRVGVPVLVRVSYFPNWRASGADGPWRATPNWMVVLPTANDVTLHYSARSTSKLLGLLLTLGGLVYLVFLARQSPLTMPEPLEEDPAPPRPRRAPQRGGRPGQNQQRKRPSGKRRR